MNRHIKCTVFVLIAFVVIGLNVERAWALNESKKPEGANHEKAHQAPYKATGKDIPVGVIETPTTAINAANNLGARLKGEWDFSGKAPSQEPTDNSAAGDDHTTLVADVLAGDHATHVGVAKEAFIYTAEIDAPANGGANQDGDHAVHNAAFNSFRAAVDWMYTPKTDLANPWKNHPRIALFNNSWGPGFETDDNGTNRFALFVDYFSNTRDALFVGAAGNNADAADQRINWPWDAYNGITVGALNRETDGSYTTRINWSQYWLRSADGAGGDDGTAPDIRGKPDILAPGVSISDMKAYGGAAESGTSFAAPHVAGVAAMLMEKGLNLSGPSGRNHQAIKAIILNSARKRHINRPENGFPFAKDNGGTAAQASDEDYLNGNTLRAGGTPGGVPVPHPTAEWTPSDWSYDGSSFTAYAPLDDEQGTGVLDAERALIQMDGGEQEEGTVGPIGWNREYIYSGISDKYYLNVPLKKGDFITATLCWDRVIAEQNANAALINGVVDESDIYAFDTLADLDLNFYFKDTLIAESVSTDDNVEHLHIPVSEPGDPLDYSIEVEMWAGDSVDYGLAWWTVPEPSTLLLLGMGALALLRRRRT